MTSARPSRSRTKASLQGFNKGKGEGPHPTAPERQKYPVPGSLRHILVTYNRHRLYTHPLIWTPQHLPLLRIFVSCQEPPPPNPKQIFPFPLPRHKEVWDVLLSVSTRDKPKFKIEKGHISRHASRSPALPLFFGRKPVATLSPLYIVIDAVTKVPLLSYVDHKQRCGHRRYYLRYTTKRKKEARIQAATSPSDIDPYDAAVLIAMAQDTLLLTSGTTSGDSSADLRAHLITSTPDEKGFYFYSASIPRSYLRSLDEPYGPFTSEIRITRSVFPIWLDNLRKPLCEIFGVPLADLKFPIREGGDTENKRDIDSDDGDTDSDHDLERPAKRQKVHITPPSLPNANNADIQGERCKTCGRVWDRDQNST